MKDTIERIVGYFRYAAPYSNEAEWQQFNKAFLDCICVVKVPCCPSLGCKSPMIGKLAYKIFDAQATDIGAILDSFFE